MVHYTMIKTRVHRRCTLEVIEVTEMKRITIALSDDLDSEILKMRKQDEFVRCSYSEIVRRLVAAGLEAIGRKEQR